MHLKFIEVCEHSFCPKLLTGGVAIDVGCRDFGFSQAMYDMGCDVYAFDIEEMTPPDGIKFFRQAVMNKNGVVNFSKNTDPQATHISEFGAEQVECIDINTVYRSLLLSQTLKGKHIDVLKLDCEGSEYFILSDPNFQPIPKQLSIEWHAHSQPELHNKYYETCYNNIITHYTAVRHELTDQHCAGLNYWDSLFVRTDLIK